MGFFSNIFGKKNCAICGKECGVMSRTGIKEKQVLCSDCGNKCSRYVRLSEFTLEDVKGHMAYMERMERLYNEVFCDKAYKKKIYPSTPDNMGINFCDDLGMLYIIDKTSGRGKMPELIRYDQIASYTEYLEETPAQEAGKAPAFKEGGLKIKLVGQRDVSMTENKKGLRPHPYIKNELKICFSTKDKQKASYAENARGHLDFIFGVNDNKKGLFNIGMTKEEKRKLMGAVGMVKAMGTVAKAAVNGGADSLTEEQKAELGKNLNAAADAQTGGLAVYTRRADEAEEKII